MALIVTDNFKTIIPDATPGEGTLFDERHLVYCLNSSNDIPQYLNYMEMVKNIAQRSKKGGLLDLGFLPVIMPPSFFQDSLHRLLLPLLKVKYFAVKSQSFFGNSYVSDYPDIWVSKLDAAAIVKKEPYAITVKDVLEVTLC